MRSRITYTGNPSPDQDPETEEQTMPDPPQRQRRQVVATTRTGLMAVAVMATSMLFAQSTPATPSTPATTPKSMTHSTTQQPRTTQPEKGWTMFNEDMGKSMDLKADQMKRLQAVDSRYKERYSGLGATPWTNAGYAPLTEQRNTEVKSILTPQQYDKWDATYGGKPATTAPAKHDGHMMTHPEGNMMNHPDSNKMNHSDGHMMNHSDGNMMNHSDGNMMNHPAGTEMTKPAGTAPTKPAGMTGTTTPPTPRH